MGETFHCLLHSRHEFVRFAQNDVEINGIPVRPLEFERQTTFRLSFDDVVAKLSQIPRMFVELDGSFVWVVEDDPQRFQLDGVLNENSTHLCSVELKGQCDQEMLDRLLAAFGWPSQELVFQLVCRGVYLEERDFRRVYCE